MNKFKVGDRIKSGKNHVHIFKEVTETNYVYEVWRNGELIDSEYEFPISQYHFFDDKEGYETVDFPFTKLEKALK